MDIHLPFTNCSISKEIDYLEKQLLFLQNKSRYLYQIACETNKTLPSLTKVKNEEIELRLMNLSEQIYTLQMKQLAESIIRIEKYKKNNGLYRLTLDSITNLSTVDLNDQAYHSLLSYRDPFHCSNITDVFVQDDASSKVSNSNNHEYIKGAKALKAYLPSSSTPKRFKYYIGEFQLPKYNVCHHCRLLKSNDDLIECQYMNKQREHNQNDFNNNTNSKSKNKYSNITTSTSNHNSTPSTNFPEPQVKVLFINKSILFKKERYYLLQHLDGNIRELIDEYFSYKKHNTYECNRFYCKSCLKVSYDITVEPKNEKDFICPGCLDCCACSRCFRLEQLIKLIACFISLGGDLDKLYELLCSRNEIFLKSRDDLVMSKFVILDIRDNKGNCFWKGVGNVSDVEGCSDVNVNDVLKYKNVVEEYLNYFGEVYEQAKMEKMLNCIDMEIKGNGKRLLNRKRNKEGKMHVDNSNSNNNIIVIKKRKYKCKQTKEEKMIMNKHKNVNNKICSYSTKHQRKLRPGTYWPKLKI